MAALEDSVGCEDFATCGVAQFQNRQYAKNQKQQDSYFVVEDVGSTFGAHLGRAHRVSLYGVADGHGEFGEISANFVRRNLPPQLGESPRFAAGHLGDSLLEAFVRTEQLQQSAGLPLWASGTCVSAAAISPTHIVVANCGDCRCVLAEQGVARDLSNDHNVERASPEELKRVVGSGGTITPDGRVTVAGAPGRLSVTRSFGDYWAKPQGPPEGHVVSALPEIVTVVRNPGQQLLILASDGIFGFMSSQDVVGLCLSAANQAGPASPLSRLAHAAVCTAVHARQSDDNCTCLVVNLSRVEDGVHMVPNRGQPQGWPGHVPAWPEGMRLSPCHTPSVPVDVASLPLPKGGADSLPGDGPNDGSDLSLSSVVAPDEVCWCPWCWRQGHDGEPGNVVLGSIERWRSHMQEQHFDKLGESYGPEELVPCCWCCRPCVTKKGQSRAANRLPFWGSHERVCKENPNKPPLPGHFDTGFESDRRVLWREGSGAAPRSPDYDDSVGELPRRSRGSRHRWPEEDLPRQTGSRKSPPPRSYDNDARYHDLRREGERPSGGLRGPEYEDYFDFPSRRRQHESRHRWLDDDERRPAPARKSPPPRSCDYEPRYHEHRSEGQHSSGSRNATHGRSSGRRAL